jgi:competence protein ComEC
MEMKERMTKIISVRFLLPALVIVGLLVALAFSWRPDGKLHVHALNVEGMPAFVQTPNGRQVLIGGSNSPSALLAALGARLPFWDRDIDLVVVPDTDARALNGLLAVIDRYQVGQIVSVEVKDNRVSREWLDALAAKSIPVIEPGSNVVLEEGVVLTLDGNGWVRLETGVTVAGFGQPDQDSRADVLVLNEVAGDTPALVQAMQASLVVTSALIEPLDGVTVVAAQPNAVELLFDGAQWEVRAAP